MRCLVTKEVKFPLIFKCMRIVLPWKQNRAFETRNLICMWVCLFIQYCQSIIRLTSYVFYQNCVNMNVGGVNNRTLGIIKIDKF